MKYTQCRLTLFLLLAFMAFRGEVAFSQGRQNFITPGTPLESRAPSSLVDRPESPAAMPVTDQMDTHQREFVDDNGAVANGAVNGDFSGSFFEVEPEYGTGTLIRKKVQTHELKLKRFGFDFFQKTGGFQPDQMALVGPDYVVGPGGVLKIDIWGTIEGTYDAPVDRNGDITLPRVGVIHLWGQSLAEARETIRKQVSKYFKNFELNITLGELRSIQVYLVGEVNSPGPYRVSSLATVLTTLSQAGGVSKNGSLRQVQLMRNGELVQAIDFYDFFLAGDKSSDVRLQSGIPSLFPLPVRWSGSPETCVVRRSMS